MDNSIQKFLALDAVKRDRIINASMKEFRYGYKKASTDAIVKSAGISKGLLFHYFGTKENLYGFLIRYVMDEIQKEYYDMLDVTYKDVLDKFWQTALLKKDISGRYPYVFEFTGAIYLHKDDVPESEIFYNLHKKYEKLESEFYKHCDISLFRSDVDPFKAIDLIAFAVNGFFEYADAKEYVEEKEDYEKFLEELRDYLDIFRLCFYKN